MTWKARLKLAFEKVSVTYLQAMAAFMLLTANGRYDLSILSAAAYAAIPAGANAMIAFVPQLPEDGNFWVKLLGNTVRTAAVAFLGYFGALAAGAPIDKGVATAALFAAVTAALAVLKGVGSTAVGNPDTPNLTV